MATSGHVHTLLTAAEMQAVDARAVAHAVTHAGAIDGFALMCRAGEAVARQARRRVDRGARIVVVAGPGNNGGDGAIAARALVEAGYAVTLIRAGGAARRDSDAARAFASWSARASATDASAASRSGSLSGSPDAAAARAAGTSLVVDMAADRLAKDVREAIAQADLLVDALLGAGLSRDLEGLFAELVRTVDASAAPVLAVDLPSGLDGDRHEVRGIAARARWTVSFVRLKPAHCLYPGRALCGEVLLEEIGMPDEALAAAPIDCRINDPSGWCEALRAPTATTHKFLRGHVLVRGGPVHQTGAARLSATAALRAGAGLVTLACPHDALAVNAARLTAVMLRVRDAEGAWRTLLDDERIGVVVAGPGNGVDESTRQDVDDALAAGKPCVLDADALSCHREAPERFVETLRAAPGALVLTPHDGEFERLFAHTDILALPSRLHRARAAAALAGAVIVSKGADTVVAAPDGRATIAVNAPPWLATAGAGDVLAGVIAALLAQGTPAFEAASAAVWLHGEAARGLGWPLTAEQLPSAIAHVLGRIVALDPPPRPRLPVPLTSLSRSRSTP